MYNKIRHSSFPYLLILLALFFVAYFVVNLISPGKLDHNTKKIEEVVESYIKTHPEVILSSLEEMQSKKMKEMEEQAQKSLLENKSILEDVSKVPFAGSQESDVTIIEFFDYNCGYCKRAALSVEKLLAEDKKVKIIFRELPILSEASVVASKYALAIFKQNPDKYLEFHNKLMHANATTEALVKDEVKKMGFDVAMIEKLSKDKEIEALIDENREIAKKLGVKGTPYFVIGKQAIPGALPYEELKKSVDDERAKVK